MPTQGDHCAPRPAHERGSALVAVGACIVLLVGFAGLAVDVGQLAVQKNWLQATADAAVLAGVVELAGGDPSFVTQQIATLNYPDAGTVVAESDIEQGRWDPQTRTFTAGAAPPNALRVTARRATANGNPLPTIFMGVLGYPLANVSAVAIASVGGGGKRTCFLADDEMIDSDLPAIEALAASLGRTPDEIISDGDGDGYIDLPPGTEIELPTGQVGDEGLFEPQPGAFPFSQSSAPYTLADFLEHQDGEGPIPDGMLDPLEGVRSVSDPSEYPSFVNPDETCVVPIYKSDISDLGSNKVNAKGERRGLLAFSIIAIGADPDGPGSVLPNIVIRVADPTDIDLREVVVAPGGGGPQLVS